MKRGVGVLLAAIGQAALSGAADKVDFGAPVVLSACGCTVTSVSEISNEFEVHKSRFLGAGPRIGVEGAAPLGRGWSFDYLADAAVLFGTRCFT